MNKPFTVKIPATIKPLLKDLGRIACDLGVPAYLVGGCVRDWLLGLTKTIDLDVTVEGDGIAIARHVADALEGTVTLHQQFGTATVQLTHRRGDLRIDVATCRKDTYTQPAAYPKVSPGTLEEDLFRRDFTINAMAMAISPGSFGALIDPFGGAGDLARHRLRALHARSFLDDPSRILRGVRFAQRFALRWERTTQRAARAAIAAGALSWLNAGRLGRELERMAEEPDPLACFRQLAKLLEV